MIAIAIAIAAAVAVAAPIDDADRRIAAPPRNAEETAICPWHRSDWAGLDRSCRFSAHG